MKRLQIIVFYGIFLTLFGCNSTKKVSNNDTREEQKHEMLTDSTRYSSEGRNVTSEKKDSIRVHDSVFVYLKGDTTYVYKERIVNKYNVVHDTLVLWNIDTLHINVAKNDSTNSTHFSTTKEIKQPPNFVYIAILIAGLIIFFAISYGFYIAYKKKLAA